MSEPRASIDPRGNGESRSPEGLEPEEGQGSGVQVQRTQKAQGTQEL